MKKAIFYASNKGFAGDVAKRIAGKLNIADIFDIKDISVNKITGYSHVILVVSTHADGEIQRDLKAQLDDFKALNFSNTTLALVGLGDGVGHADTFNNALGEVYDIVSAGGANTVGNSENEGYVYEATTALRNGKFPGLALDLPNQSLINEERINAWIAQISTHFA